MSGFDRAVRSEADAKIGHQPRSCAECKYAEINGHPCDTCDGPGGYWTPKDPIPGHIKEYIERLEEWFGNSRGSEINEWGSIAEACADRIDRLKIVAGRAQQK